MRWKNPSRTWDALEEESEAIKEFYKYKVWSKCPPDLKKRLKKDPKFLLLTGTILYKSMFGIEDVEVHLELYPDRFFERFPLNHTINMIYYAINKKCRIEDLDYYKELDGKLKDYGK